MKFRPPILLRTRFFSCIPLIAVALGITFASSLPGTNTAIELTSAFDKLQHFSAFAIFACCLGWAIHHNVSYSLSMKVILTLLGASFFGAVDEFHQTFVFMRQASIADWIADTLGGAFGALLTFGTLYLRRKSRAENL